jgi:hypothetical protein
VRGRETEQARRRRGPGIPPPVTLDQLIWATHCTHKMGPSVLKTKRSKAARVCEALDKERNPLSEEEIHLICTCCQIMKIDEKEKIDSMLQQPPGKKMVRQLE